MEDINPIYSNEFGMAFQWKKNTLKDNSKIQLVFKDTGLFITREELISFSQNVMHSVESNYLQCENCAQNDSCRKLLLNTPAYQVTLALDTMELFAMKDLVEGTIFQLDLGNYLDSICSNN
ncbi:DUF6686 family protein [uncultured Maribacter sp.]|uniref:DUF6686 family protein n=1 Tax=uncultured Maribacter sp. TaxID=431308 RepID=UPI00262D7494|nr:DUF6686 family protein [uncultured Maribacter sp.]